jgi:hypothetical protein
MCSSGRTAAWRVHFDADGPLGPLHLSGCDLRSAFRLGVGVDSLPIVSNHARFPNAFKCRPDIRDVCDLFRNGSRRLARVRNHNPHISLLGNARAWLRSARPSCWRASPPQWWVPLSGHLLATSSSDLGRHALETRAGSPALFDPRHQPLPRPHLAGEECDTTSLPFSPSGSVIQQRRPSHTTLAERVAPKSIVRSADKRAAITSFVRHEETPRTPTSSNQP